MSERNRFIAARKWSRFFLIQALYEWQLNQNSLQEITQHFAENKLFEKANTEYFHELLSGIIQEREALEVLISPFLDRDLNQVDPIEKAILWLGSYELRFRPDLPFKVVINEAVELSKKFGNEGGHRYINSILDKVSKELQDG